MIRIDGEQHPNLVTFGEPGEDPLLGSVTLETFSLAVDPVNKRLEPVHSLELATVETLPPHGDYPAALPSFVGPGNDAKRPRK